jgi:hypothetical protein
MRWKGMEEPSGVERNGCGAMGVGDRSVHVNAPPAIQNEFGLEEERLETGDSI